MPKSARSPTPSPKPQPRRRPRNLRPAEASRLLHAFEHSSLSRAEFERRHDLSRNRLSWWRKRLGAAATATDAQPAPASVTFLPVRIEVPLRAAPPPVAAAPIELVLPDGTIVRLPPTFDVATSMLLWWQLFIEICSEASSPPAWRRSRRTRRRSTRRSEGWAAAARDTARGRTAGATRRGS